MFFTENQIKDKTSCEKCKRVFNDPRSLPCGECLCNDCILSGIKNQKIDGYICFFCKEIHNVPTNGFPVNKLALSLLEMKPNVEDKFDALDEFKNQLKKIRNHLDSLISSVNLSDEIVTEHCVTIKNQIEKRSENLIQKIVNYKEELLIEIDDYELECKDNISKEKSKFEEKIKNNTKIFDEYNEYLNKQNVDESLLTQLNKNAIKQTQSLEKEIKKFNAVIFNNKKRKFNENKYEDIDSSKIGKIVYEPLVSIDLRKSSKTINLQSKIKSFSSFVSTLIMENGSIVIVYMDMSQFYKICIFDENHNLKKTSKAPSLIKYGTPICYNFGEKILFYYCYNFYRLLIMNQDLIILKNFPTRKKYFSVCGNSQNIIGLYQGKLDIFNADLELLQTVGQNYNSLPFYVDSLNVIDDILILNDKYILKRSNNIIIANINDGIQVASIDIEAHQIVTKNNKIYAVVSNNNDEFEVQVYDSNGDLEHKNLLKGFSKNFLLSFNEDRIDFSLDITSLILNEY
jgi:hypothetical protein